MNANTCYWKKNKTAHIFCLLVHHHCWNMKHEWCDFINFFVNIHLTKYKWQRDERDAICIFRLCQMMIMLKVAYLSINYKFWKTVHKWQLFHHQKGTIRASTAPFPSSQKVQHIWCIQDSIPRSQPVVRLARCDPGRGWLVKLHPAKRGFHLQVSEWRWANHVDIKATRVWPYTFEWVCRRYRSVDSLARWLSPIVGVGGKKAPTGFRFIEHRWSEGNCSADKRAHTPGIIRTFFQ